MFRITAGETWVESLPKDHPDGSVNWQAAIYITSYIIIENWLLFQVFLLVLSLELLQAVTEVAAAPGLPVALACSVSSCYRVPSNLTSSHYRAGGRVSDRDSPRLNPDALLSVRR
jgi:hypothetical protein